MQRCRIVVLCLALAGAGPALAQEELPFAPARWAGDLLYVSGQVGNLPGRMELVEGGIRAETRQALVNLGAVLADNGAGFEDVVQCTAMLADVDEWAAMNQVYVTFFDPPRPARSALGANGLALGARVEIACIAHVPGSPPCHWRTRGSRRAPSRRRSGDGRCTTRSTATDLR